MKGDARASGAGMEDAGGRGAFCGSQGRPWAARNVADCRGKAPKGKEREREKGEWQRGRKKEEGERGKEIGVRTILLFTVFFSQCPAARARRGTLAFSLPARTRESTPRLSPRLLTGAEVTRAEGPQSARLFAIGTISEPISIGQK